MFYIVDRIRALISIIPTSDSMFTQIRVFSRDVVFTPFSVIIVPVSSRCSAQRENNTICLDCPLIRSCIRISVLGSRSLYCCNTILRLKYRVWNISSLPKKQFFGGRWFKVFNLSILIANNINHFPIEAGHTGSFWDKNILNFSSFVYIAIRSTYRSTWTVYGLWWFKVWTV